MKSVYIILMAVVFAIMTYTVISLSNKKTEKDVKALFYKGVITKIYQEPMQHNMYFFDILTEEYGAITINASWWAGSWPWPWTFANVGDSVIKPPNELIIIIKKPDDESKEFYYR